MTATGTAAGGGRVRGQVEVDDATVGQDEQEPAPRRIEARPGGPWRDARPGDQPVAAEVRGAGRRGTVGHELARGARATGQRLEPPAEIGPAPVAPADQDGPTTGRDRRRVLEVVGRGDGRGIAAVEPQLADDAPAA